MSITSIDWLMARGVSEDLAAIISSLPTPYDGVVKNWDKIDDSEVKAYRAKVASFLFTNIETVAGFMTLATPALLALFGSNLYPGEHIDHELPVDITESDWKVLSSLIMMAARMIEDSKTSGEIKDLPLTAYIF